MEENEKVIFGPFDETRIAYICDRQKCKRCDNRFCSHTVDINHAKNFKLNGDVFFEISRDKELINKKIENAYDVLADMLYKYDGKKQPLKVELIDAMEEAVGYLGEVLE